MEKLSRHGAWIWALFGLASGACSSSTSNGGSEPSDGGGTGADTGVTGGRDGGGGPADSGGGGGDSGGGRDAGSDSGGGSGPTDPNNPQTVTAGQTISGTIPASMTLAHFYRYVPTQAFTNVRVNVTTLSPNGTLGRIGWQTNTTVGLCDLTGGRYCCIDRAACDLTIREGTMLPFMPVVVGKSYYIIVAAGERGALSYAFNLTETP